MNPVDALFQRLRVAGRKAFIPFITAGDPDLEFTKALVRELVRRGADLIEIGFPYSDPIADGPVIQASYTRALARGLRVDDIFRTAHDIHLKVPAPLVGMVSYTLVHKRGPAAFLRDSRDAGFAGLIVPDLPVEEVQALAGMARQHELAFILLTTPTTPRERAQRIAQLSTGFLYCVSVTGITGERTQLPEDVLTQLAWLRQQTDLPLCAGFGISTPEHVRLLRSAVDGVIVGSAIVRHLETAEGKPRETEVSAIGDLVRRLVSELNDEGPDTGPISSQP
jgi:tryptophan synthase alpha chain